MNDYKEYTGQVQEWIQKTFESRGVNAEETIQYCNNIIEYGQKNQDEKLLGFAYYYIAETYYILNDTNDFFKNIMTSISYLDSSGQWELMARAYNFMAITSMNRGNAPFAMDYYLSALAYCNMHHIDEVGIMVNINIGILYHTFGDDMQAQRYFDASLAILEAKEEIPGHGTLLMNVYLGMANIYLARQQTDKAAVCVEKAGMECARTGGKIDELCFQCFKARIAQAEGKLKVRDESIKRVSELAGAELPILDVFEDLYEYCGMLLSAGKFEDLWNMLEILEKLSKQARITNMDKKILSIKIRYYKIKEDHAGFLQAAGLYYELSELLEQENCSMMGKMLNMRSFLEETNKQRKRMEKENKELHVRSETDALTGLANRFRLNNYAEAVFKESMEKGETFAIEILDIDYFKQYNDNYGHQAGDTCIYKIARQIESMEEHENIFTARYGGDEFVVIYTGYTREAVRRLMDELRKKVESLKIAHAFSEASSVVTISQGACWGVPAEGDKVWDFLHKADSMLYKMKNVSRNDAYVGEYGKV